MNQQVLTIPAEYSIYCISTGYLIMKGDSIMAFHDIDHLLNFLKNSEKNKNDF